MSPNRSVYAVMKKYDTKSDRNAAQDIQAKRQMEDRIFNRMLVWLLVAVVAEVYFVIVNRFYVHARAGEINAMVVWHSALLVLFALGLVLFAVCMLWGRKQQSSGRDSVLPFALGGGFLVAGVGSLAIRLSHSCSHLMLALVPVLAVLVIIFYLYQKEFFPCAVVSALGIVALLLYRSSGWAGKGYLLGVVLTLVAAVVGLVLMLRLKKNEGVLTVNDRPHRLISAEASYTPFFITIVVAAVVVLCPLVFGSAVAYYGIWALGAWVFILAVYFTSKLM